MASGGKRVPSQPASVSGPGALSARTDGGPGDRRTANLAAAGGGYGYRQALEAQAAGAPVPDGAQAGPRPDPSAGQMGGSSDGVQDPFRPTERPGESPLAGQIGEPAPDQLNDPQMIFRQLARVWPTPWILGMLND